MAYWSARQMGVMFGGVVDEEVSEEGLESVFLNDAYGYQTGGNGRWVGLALKKAKKKAGAGPKKKSKKEKEDDDEEDVGPDRVICSAIPLTCSSPRFIQVWPARVRSTPTILVSRSPCHGTMRCSPSSEIPSTCEITHSSLSEV